MSHAINCLPIAGITPSEGVVMLASTNRPEVLDKALLRPGRFDRQIMISLPTLLERKAIFEVYLKTIVLGDQVEKFSSRLAALTPGNSGECVLGMLSSGNVHWACSVGGTPTFC